MAFTARRPAALLRFIVPAFLIIFILYYLSGPDSSTYSIPIGQGTVSQPGKTHQDDHHGAAGGDQTHNEKPAPVVPEHKDEYQNAPVVTPSLSKVPIVASPMPSPTPSKIPSASTPAPAPAGTHPIEVRIKAAEDEFAEKLSRESKSLEDAAAAYRKRRGRHPPPGFKEWYEFAKENDAVIVEDFWDQIYHDLEPFWALEPARIRKDAWNFEMRISIRDGKADSGSDWFWTKIWLSLIKTIENYLPDMDIALNAMDEPRLVVPWETVDQYVTEAHEARRIPDADSVVTEFPKLPPSDQDPEGALDKAQRSWESKNKHYWLVARRGCPPDSPARQAEIMEDFSKTPTIDSSFALAHMEHGYVKNYTLSTEFCHQPDMQGLNGIFVESLSVSATDSLFPLFGGSKLAVNNEILLPAPMYWNEEERFMGKMDEHPPPPWEDKQDGVIWRGVATGGRNRETNWRAFQRHRFVAMNNGTKLSRAEQWTELPNNFALPTSGYDLKAQEDGRLGEWVASWANVSFVDLMCGYKDQKGLGCNYTDPYFAVTPGVKLDRQFEFKYLPDIDGNSFSGRYLGFLRSTSLPIKATLWREWHDSRLVAWKHFVPMDSRYSDWYGIMEYFLGYVNGKTGRKVAGHDAVAKKIAMDGKDWADKALRKEDMRIYVLRLLLEYARLSSDERASMGWVGDLTASVSDPDA